MPRGRPRKQEPAETPKQRYAPDIQDKLVQRITECQSVLDHWDSCPALKVIAKDLEFHRQYIDDNWQNIAEGDPKLKELRVTKLAYVHLLNLKESYRSDLETAKKELGKLQNTDREIIKDYET
jgi:hypothetical protein